MVDPDFCGDHQWTCPGRQRYVNIYFFPFDKSTRQFHEKIINFTEVEVRKVKKNREIAVGNFLLIYRLKLECTRHEKILEMMFLLKSILW